MSKRPAVERIPLCCNASVKEGEHFIKNKIFSYSMDETWEKRSEKPFRRLHLHLDVVASWDGRFSSEHGRTNMKGDMQA